MYFHLIRLLSLLFGVFKRKKKRRRPTKKQIIRLRNKRIFRMLMARNRQLKDIPLDLKSIIKRGKERQKMPWQQKMSHARKRTSHTERNLHIERKALKMRERIQLKRRKAVLALSI